jgi:hypothetical protein
MESLALLCTLHADGPTTLKRLRRSGCQSLQDLEAYRPETLATLLEVTPAVARRLGREARVLRERLDLTGDSAVLEREEAPEPLTAASTAELPVERAATTESRLGRHDRAIVDQVVQSWDRDLNADEQHPSFDDEPPMEIDEPVEFPSAPAFEAPAAEPMVQKPIEVQPIAHEPSAQKTKAPEPLVTFLPETTDEAPTRAASLDADPLGSTPLGNGVEWARVETPTHDAPLRAPVEPVAPSVEAVEFEKIHTSSESVQLELSGSTPFGSGAELSMDVLGDVRGSSIQDPIPMSDPVQEVEAPALTNRPTPAPLVNLIDGLDADLAERLSVAGIRELSALASADCAPLAARLGVAFGTLRRLQFLARRRSGAPRTLPGVPIPLRIAAKIEEQEISAKMPAAMRARVLAEMAAAMPSAAKNAPKPEQRISVSDLEPGSSTKPVPDQPTSVVPVSAHRAADLSGRHSSPASTAAAGPMSFGMGIQEEQRRVTPAPIGSDLASIARPEADPNVEVDDEPITDAPPIDSSFGAGVIADAGRRDAVDPPPLSLAAPRHVTRPEPMSSPALTAKHMPAAPPVSPVESMSSPSAESTLTFESAAPMSAEAQASPLTLETTAQGVPVEPAPPRRPFWEARARDSASQSQAEASAKDVALRPNPPAVGYAMDQDTAPIINTPVGTWSQRKVAIATPPMPEAAEQTETEPTKKDTLGWDFVIPGPDEAGANLQRPELSDPEPMSPAREFPRDEDVAGPFA